MLIGHASRHHSMAIGIPQRFRPGLNRIAQLSDPDLQALADALTGLPTFPSRVEITRSIRSVISADEDGDFERVTDALMNLAVQRRRWAPDELAELVASASVLDVPDDRRESFAAFVRRAVEAEALVSAARGLDIIFDREHIATDARVLTDIRPV